MPRIMEQMLMICALAVGVTATAVSCRDATEPGLQAPGIEVSLERRIADLQTQTEWMGKFHTDALTYIQSQLAAAKATARTAQERCRVASRAFKDFTRAFRKDGAPLTLPPDFDAGFGCDDGVPLGMRPTVLIAGSGGILPRRDDLSPQAQSSEPRLLQSARPNIGARALAGGAATMESRWRLRLASAPLELPRTSVPRLPRSA